MSHELAGRGRARPLGLGGGTSRALNEIIDSGTALEQDNELVIRRQAGPGVFDVSDLIFTYSADA